jgi:putative tributyrin esterase
MIINLTYFSQALAKMTGLVVAHPDGDGPFPVVIQLHGLSDDHTVWARRTSIERYADAHRMIIAMPDGGRGFYTDAGDGHGRHEQQILETIALVDRTFRTIADRRGRAIGGLSMGGYGAMKFGLKYPHLFGSVAAHSGVLDIRESIRIRRWADVCDRVYPKGPARADDCFHLARGVAKLTPAKRPQIRFDCGTDDFLIQQNRDFRAHLLKLKLPHEYQEFPGAHTWDYWDLHVQEALAFHRRWFDRAAPKPRPPASR